jgi:rod shape-determining protein MreC
MFNLVQLLKKLSGFLVFLVLEVICFSLVVRYNGNQEKVYTNTVNKFTGWLQQKSTSTYQYFQLYDENKRLAKENSLLLDRLANLGINVQNPLDTAWADSIQPKYTFLDAKVIRNSINQHHNYITLDKGAKDGIRPHTGVVTDDGVVGIIRKVSQNYSVAMSILHRQAIINARVRHKNYFGPLVWKSDNIHTFNLENIPKDAPVTKGDTIETSGYSTMFPPGITIGVIDKLWMDPGSNFFTIEVRSFAKLSNIQHAYIVRNIFKQEQEQLEESVKSEDE